jgi:hypothetical protein
MTRRPFTDALTPLAAKLPTAREREILRVAASLKGGNPQQAATTARGEILRWLQNRTSGQLPRAAWDGEQFEHLAGGRNCVGVRIADPHKDIWAVRADDPDKNTARRIWTTEVVVGHAPDQRALFSLRLLVNSPEADLDCNPAVPGLMLQMSERCGLERGEFDIVSKPWVVNSQSDAEDLMGFLENPDRDVPAFVLTVPEDSTDPDAPLIDGVALARATIGIAKVLILPAEFTWALTNRYGKRLSVFSGAARIYLPGFDEDADPYGGHELYLCNVMDTHEGAKSVAYGMQRLAASQSLRGFRLGREVLSFADVRNASLDQMRENLERRGAADSEKLAAARAQIRALKQDLKNAEETHQWLSDEHKSAEERATAAEEQSIVASYRIRQLTEQLRERGQDPDATISVPQSWSGFSDWCEQHLIGRVTLSACARRSVKNSLFQDVETAAQCLLWLANDYRDRRLGGGDGDLRVSLGQGIRNDQCGADSFSMPWRGMRKDVQWHIKNGGNTRDPSRCLRIYYFWDQASQEVVIAFMPGHIRTGAT